nr:DUF4439 domain-containing protein [Corynebacterium lactis]
MSSTPSPTFETSRHDNGLPARPLCRRNFLAAALATLATPALASCTHLVAPRPDAAIEVLHALAARDAELLSGAKDAAEAGTVSQIRSAQAEKLGAEIARACGTLKDGNKPERCGDDVHLGSTAADGSDPVALLIASRSDTALLDSLAQRSTLREDYQARLATATDGGVVLAARAVGASWKMLTPKAPATPADGSGPNLLRGAEDQIAAALSAEYALIYGLGVAAPHVGSDNREAVEARGERHRAIRDEVTALYGSQSLRAPAPAPGYSDAPGAPSPQDKPVEYLAALERSCAQAWEDVVKAAAEAPTRLFALQAAGLSAAGASALGGAELEPLPGLE